MSMISPIDDLVYAETPAVVWHTSAASFQWAAHERCAVTTGLMVLQPSESEYLRAMALLQDTSRFEKSQFSRYDGGDQAFW